MVRRRVAANNQARKGKASAANTYLHRDSVRRRRRKISQTVTVLGVLCGLGYMAWLGYAKLSWFSISRIEIEGAKNLEVAKLKQQIQSANARIFNLDLEQIKRNLSLDPLVKQATVSLGLPGTLKIKIAERSDFAQIKLVDSIRYFTVDEEGVILGGGALLQPGLPCITGVDLPDTTLGKPCQDRKLLTGLKILSAFKAAHWLDKVTEISVLDLQCPVLTLKGGIEVRLGADNFTDKVSSLQTLWQNMNARIREVDYIDLRFSSMAVVKFKNQNV